MVSGEESADDTEAFGMGAYQVKTLLKIFRYYQRYGMAGGVGLSRP